ncbi:hypothetical protein E2320_004365 [Naja naja]|nr:hypothetical protein E2320_004365 [Naja naja]
MQPTYQSWKDVTNGHHALPGTWPWLISIQIYTPKGPRHSCDGAVVDIRWILTAAHCFNAKKNSLKVWKIVLGATDLSRLPDIAQLRSIKRIIFHQDYNPTTKINDVALIELDNPVIFNDYVQPICLPPVSLDSDAFSICYGYGAGILMCKTLPKSPYYIVGISNSEKDCDRIEYPQIYTSVEQFLEWISRKMGSEEVRKEKLDHHIENTSSVPTTNVPKETLVIEPPFIPQEMIPTLIEPPYVPEETTPSPPVSPFIPMETTLILEPPSVDKPSHLGPKSVESSTQYPFPNTTPLPPVYVPPETEVTLQPPYIPLENPGHLDAPYIPPETSVSVEPPYILQETTTALELPYTPQEITTPLERPYTPTETAVPLENPYIPAETLATLKPPYIPKEIPPSLEAPYNSPETSPTLELPYTPPETPATLETPYTPPETPAPLEPPYTPPEAHASIKPPYVPPETSANLEPLYTPPETPASLETPCIPLGGLNTYSGNPAPISPPCVPPESLKSPYLSSESSPPLEPSYILLENPLPPEQPYPPPENPVPLESLPLQAQEHYLTDHYFSGPVLYFS